MGRDTVADSGRRVDCTEAIPRVHGGDERRGFEIFREDADRLVRMRLWGNWHVTVEAAFRSGILAVARRLAGAPWFILSDSRQFNVQSPEIARLRLEVMTLVTQLGCQKIAAIVSSVRYSQQFLQISEESHARSAVFLDEKSAIDWIYECRQT